MTDPLEQVLRLVSEGRLSAAQAAPILDALNAAEDAQRMAGAAADAATGASADAAAAEGKRATSIRIEVTDGGRQTVNLRVPVTLGRLALDRIPGLSGSNVDLIRQALAEGRSGTLLVVDDDGDGVRISLE